MADGLRARSDHPTSRQINRTSLQNTYLIGAFLAILKRMDGSRNPPANPNAPLMRSGAKHLPLRRTNIILMSRAARFSGRTCRRDIISQTAEEPPDRPRSRLRLLQGHHATRARDAHEPGARRRP